MTVSLTLKNIRRLYVKDNEEFAAVDNEIGRAHV